MSAARKCARLPQAQLCYGLVETEGRAKRENIHVMFVDLPRSNCAEAGITVEDQRKAK